MNIEHQRDGSVPNDIKSLHLPDFQIVGFRAFDDLTVSRLGRVNLFAGENSVGKTTFLEAVRLFAARGRVRVLQEILVERQELRDTLDSDGDRVFMVDWSALFHTTPGGTSDFVSIGPKNSGDVVSVSIGNFDRENAGQLEMLELARSRRRSGYVFDFQDARVLTVHAGRSGYYIPISDDREYGFLGSVSADDDDLPPEIPSVLLGPNLPENKDIERFWDALVEEKREYGGIHALGLILPHQIIDVLLVSGTSLGMFDQGRRPVVGLQGQSRRMPLKSLGDGAIRAFSMAVAIANCRGGILVVDEVENGVHHSRQRLLWKMIFETARENNVQIFATTHSWDCVHAFALTASEFDEGEGVLVRLERDQEAMTISAKEYSDLNLRVAAEQGIEVR
ncbi:MAG: AAA family ATPase [Chloroflexi bacterium]|nr:AAA family ATPase [Chloroflexota bacterium]